jgi:predicted methyltransferase
MGCDRTPPAAEPPPESTSEESASEATPAAPAATDLPAILAAQSDEIQARYVYRHPQETLEFFGIRPGMTVVEALPGGGWYSRLLLPYLGESGRLIGANYAFEMWPKFGFFDQDFIDTMATWTTDWPAEAAAWQDTGGATVEAFDFGSMPAAMAGQADAVLFVRALHNLARFEDDGGYLTAALNDAHRVLKPGGIVGVVQHEARPDMSDDWASGANGYLKKQFVIDRMNEAGFEFVEASDINQNPNDQPTEEDVVWRLPPSYFTSEEDPELQAKMDAIGESNRMTLKFRKPE